MIPGMFSKDLRDPVCQPREVGGRKAGRGQRSNRLLSHQGNFYDGFRFLSASKIPDEFADLGAVPVGRKGSPVVFR